LQDGSFFHPNNRWSNIVEFVLDPLNTNLAFKTDYDFMVTEMCNKHAGRCGTTAEQQVDGLVQWLTQPEWINHEMVQRAVADDLTFAPADSMNCIRGQPCRAEIWPFLAAGKDNYGKFSVNESMALFMPTGNASVTANSTRVQWEHAMQYCSWKTTHLDKLTCPTMQMQTASSNYTLPFALAQSDGYSLYAYNTNSTMRDMYYSHVCSVVGYMKFLQYNSSWMNGMTAAELTLRLNAQPNMSVALTADNVKDQARYLQFGGGHISQHAFNSPTLNVGPFNDGPVEINALAAAIGFSSVSLPWTDAKAVLDDLAKETLNQTMVEEWLPEYVREGNQTAVTNTLIAGMIDHSSGIDVDLSKMPSLYRVQFRRTAAANIHVSAGLRDVGLPMVKAGETTSLARLLGSAAMAMGRRQLQQFACPLKDGLSNSTCPYTHGGLFRKVSPRNLLFSGYQDTYTAPATRAAIPPETTYTCTNRRWFAHNDGGTMRSFTAAELEAENDDEVDGQKETYQFIINSTCDLQEDLDCTKDGWTVSVPKKITRNTAFVSLSEEGWAPFVYDRDNMRGGYHDRLVDYPVAEDFFKHNFTIPSALERITQGSRTQAQEIIYSEEKIPTNNFALMFGGLYESDSYQRRQTCAGVLDYGKDGAWDWMPNWKVCGMRMNENQLSVLGTQSSIRGYQLLQFYPGKPGHPYYGIDGKGVSGVQVQGTFGDKIAPNLWAGFLTPFTAKTHIDKFVIEGLGDKDGHLGGMFPMRLAYDGVFKTDREMKQFVIPRTWTITKGDKSIGADNVTTDVIEIQLHRYILTQKTWQFTLEGLGLEFLEKPWLIPGTLPISPIRTTEKKTGLVISLPHMLYSKELGGTAHTHVDGYNPNKEIHGTSYSIEPISGKVMQYQERFQMMYQVERPFIFPAVAMHGLNETSVLLPVMWHEKLYSLPASDAQTFDDTVLMYAGVKVLVLGLGMGIGALTVMLGFVYLGKATFDLAVQAEHNKLLGGAIDQTEQQRQHAVQAVNPQDLLAAPSTVHAKGSKVVAPEHGDISVH
jgi:hypothetical protein